MPVQTTYPLVHSAAVAGAVVDGQLKNVRSSVAAVAIPFGRWIARAADGTSKLPTAAGDVTATGRGIAIRVQDDVAGAADLLQYEIGRNVSFVDFGVVWVEIETNVTEGAPAFVRHTANGGNTVLGRFRAGADTGAAAALYCVFLAAGTAGGLAPLRIRNGSDSA